MKLADQVGATVRQGKDGMVDVVVGGMTLVAGSSVAQLAVAGSLDHGGRRRLTRSALSPPSAATPLRRTARRAASSQP